MSTPSFREGVTYMFYRQPLLSSMHLLITSLGGGHAHASKGNRCSLPRTSRLSHAQKGATPTRPLQEWAMSMPPPASVPCCRTPSLGGGHAHIVFQGGGHVHATIGIRCLLPRAISRRERRPRLPFIRGPCSRVPCREGPSSRPHRQPLTTAASLLLVPFTEMGPCPRLNRQLLPAAACLSFFAYQEGGPHPRLPFRKGPYSGLHRKLLAAAAYLLLFSSSGVGHANASAGNRCLSPRASCLIHFQTGAVPRPLFLKGAMPPPP